MAEFLELNEISTVIKQVGCPVQINEEILYLLRVHIKKLDCHVKLHQGYSPELVKIKLSLIEQGLSRLVCMGTK